MFCDGRLLQWTRTGAAAATRRRLPSARSAMRRSARRPWHYLRPSRQRAVGRVPARHANSAACALPRVACLPQTNLTRECAPSAGTKGLWGNGCGGQVSPRSRGIGRACHMGGAEGERAHRARRRERDRRCDEVSHCPRPRHHRHPGVCSLRYGTQMLACAGVVHVAMQRRRGLTALPVAQACTTSSRTVCRHHHPTPLMWPTPRG